MAEAIFVTILIGGTYLGGAAAVHGIKKVIHKVHKKKSTAPKSQVPVSDGTN